MKKQHLKQGMRSFKTGSGRNRLCSFINAETIGFSWKTFWRWLGVSAFSIFQKFISEDGQIHAESFMHTPPSITSNPQPKPCDRFFSGYVLLKTNRAFPEDCHYPKKPGNTPLSGSYLSCLDINTTVSTCPSLSQHKASTFSSL